MSELNLSEIFANLTSKITIPTAFHSQCSVVKKMLKNDSTGLINSLLQFQINAANVAFTIETDSPRFTEILNKFLENINKAYNGKIPAGITPIAKEYFTERWSASSFPIIKIVDWEDIGGLSLPSKMFIVDGSSVYAKDKNDSAEKSLLQYNYYLGKAMKNKLDNNTIFNRPFCRLWDKYTDLYLIRTGVYNNYEVLKSLKEKQGKILNQIIPLIFMIQTGSEALSRENIVGQNQNYAKIIDQYGKLLKKAKTEDGVPTRATSFDEKIQHLIPDLKNIFEPKLFTVGERGILSGLGYIDIAEGISSSRKESILSPKPFIEETTAGVKGFIEMLCGVVNLIKQKNSRNIKYMNTKIKVVHSPIMAFQTEDFRTMIKNLFKAGAMSYQTTMEICGQVNFEVEKSRILKEKKDNLSKKFYPPITENNEQHPDDKGNNIPKKETNKDELPDDKTDPAKKREYKNASKKVSLIGAPFRNLTELPSDVQKLSKKFQRAFLKSWNRAYFYKLAKTNNRKKAEEYAWRVARSVLKKLKKKK